MSLIFDLSSALLATLVQQWVRDYMHAFPRYSDPLKSARLRQYLHEGSERRYMPVVAGLCEFVLNINTTVGLSTIVPIGITGLLYIFTTCMCTSHISAVAIPEFIFWPYLVYDPAIWWPWKSEIPVKGSRGNEFACTRVLCEKEEGRKKEKKEGGRGGEADGNGLG